MKYNAFKKKISELATKLGVWVDLNINKEDDTLEVQMVYAEGAHPVDTKDMKDDIYDENFCNIFNQMSDEIGDNIIMEDDWDEDELNYIWSLTIEEISTCLDDYSELYETLEEELTEASEYLENHWTDGEWEDDSDEDEDSDEDYYDEDDDWD